MRAGASSRRQTIGQKQIVAASRAEQRHEVRQEAEDGLDRPGHRQKRHQRAESGGRFSPTPEQGADGLGDEP